MSNVLVIHPDDRSTDMLKVVYEGKGYDVITDMSVSEEEVVEAIKSHDTIIMLGHGTPSGLLASDGHGGFLGYVIHDGHAELLKSKKTYSMWCNSDAYFACHGMKGFHSGMIISEDLEQMRQIILERYNADDPITQFNRKNIVIH